MANYQTPANRIQIRPHEHPMAPGIFYRKLVKRAWGKTYRSCNNGKTWHPTSSEAFWTAHHAGELAEMSKSDVEFHLNGGVELL